MRPSASLDRAPAYQKLAGTLEAMIRSRSLRPGDRVPSVRQFSAQQRVSVPTALHAYVTLESRGLIEARPKSGFYVRARLADLVPAPRTATGRPKVTDLSTLDPLDSLLADHNNPDLIPLGAALPGPELLPSLKLARSMGVIARRLGPESVGYDMAPGNLSVRQAIARRSLEWGGALRPEDLVIVNGGTEGLTLALRATCEPGDTVAIESPCYFGLVAMLRDLGLKALPIPVDCTHGLDLDALEAALAKTRIAACVVMPNFQNPTGTFMPDAARERLFTLLKTKRVPLIEDDIYGDLPHEGRRPRCLKALDPSGDCVILCGSFSKTLAPGYRVGYLAAGRWHDRALALKKSTTLANATLPTLAIGEFLRNGGYDRYLRSIRETFRQQVAKMREAVVESFPEGICLSRPLGGFLLWCELPEKADSLELFRRARESGISVAPGPLFSATGGHRNCIRLNCGHAWNPAIERSIGILGDLVRRKLDGR